MSTYAQRAEELFRQGYNCAQSVLMAFSHELEVPESALARIASGFGGGVGSSRGICGAVTGGVMVRGLGSGYGGDGPPSQDDRDESNARIQEFLRAFEVEYHSTNCGELLDHADILVESGKAPAEKKCLPYVLSAVALAKELFSPGGRDDR